MTDAMRVSRNVNLGDNGGFVHRFQFVGVGHLN